MQDRILGDRAIIDRRRHYRMLYAIAKGYCQEPPGGKGWFFAERAAIEKGNTGCPFDITGTTRKA